MTDDTLKDKILKSPEGRRMVSMVSPIYDRSYVGLWLFEVIGREYDGLRSIINSLPEQVTPQTATWLFDLWEREYGIETDHSKTLAQRRALLMSRLKNPGAFTPRKVKDYAEALTGVKARVDEHAGPFTFRLYLPVETVFDQMIINYVNRLKQAHMTFELKYEKAVSETLYFGAAANTGIIQTIRQAN